MMSFNDATFLIFIAMLLLILFVLNLIALFISRACFFADLSIKHTIITACVSTLVGILLSVLSTIPLYFCLYRWSNKSKKFCLLFSIVFTVIMMLAIFLMAPLLQKLLLFALMFPVFYQ